MLRALAAPAEAGVGKCEAQHGTWHWSGCDDQLGVVARLGQALHERATGVQAIGAGESIVPAARAIAALAQACLVG